VKLVPIGPGQARTIATDGLEAIHNGSARFLADGKHITLNANEPDHAERFYMLSLDGGKPVPLTPEGVTWGLVSPDAKYVLRAADSGAIAAYPIAGGPPRPIPNLEPGFVPVQWSEDNASVYGYRPGVLPTRAYKVELLTGKKTMIQELQPETTTGVITISPLVVTRDGSRFAYSYSEILSELYIISGLQ